jgi:hypothetical protein
MQVTRTAGAQHFEGDTTNKKSLPARGQRLSSRQPFLPERELVLLLLFLGKAELPPSILMDHW